VPRELADFFREKDRIAMEKGGPSRNEEWITFADDGHRALLETIKTPMLDTDGKLIGVLGVGRDITEQQMTQQLLAKKEAQYRLILETELNERKESQSKLETINALLTAILESSPDVIIFALDKEYRYLTFNNKHKEIMRNIWGKEIAPGMNMLEDVIGISNDRQRAKANFDRALSGEYLILIEEYGDEALTRQFWQDIYSSIYSANGDIIGLICYVLDISELKRTEEALKESEYFFKESQRAAFIGSYKANFVSNVWESSEILDQIFGIDKEYQRSVTEGWDNIIHPDDRDYMRQYLMEEVIMKHKPFNAEYRIVRKSDGETRWVNGLGKVDFDADGNVVSLIGTVQDITTRKLAEQAILDSQSKLSMALKIAHMGPWEFNVKSKQFTFTDSLYAIFRTNAHEMGGYTLSAADYITRFVHPDDRDQVAKVIYANAPVLEPNYTRQLEHRILYSNGETGYMNICFSVITDRDGKVLKSYGINQDITERKQAEEKLKESEAKFRRLFTQMNEGFSLHKIVYDSRHKAIDYEIIDINPAFERQVGITAEKAKGTRASKLYEVSPAPFLDIYTRVAETGEPHSFQTYFAPFDRYFDISVFAPTTGYFATVFTDITARKKAEEALVESESQLRELNTTKDKFFSIIAHDLRSPFASVIGLAELMADQNFKLTLEEFREHASILYKAASSTFTLLENLLEWSRLQRGLSILATDSILLKPFVDNLNESALEMASKKSIKLQFDIPSTLKVKADPNMLRTILRNLVTNAIKFTGTGGTVTIAASEKEKGVVLFSIKDTGIGIPPEMLDRLFKLDASINRRGTNNEPSSGLGLMLCKEFVEKHQGKIWVESQVGKGSIFFFTIPAPG